MKVVFTVVSAFAFLSLVLFGCSEEEGKYQEKVVLLEEELEKANKKIEEKESLIDRMENEIAQLNNVIEQKEAEIEENQTPKREIQDNDFSIVIGDVIALHDWDDEINLYKMLGQPISTEVEELGEGADTYRGSIIKTLTYDGIELTLFSPPHNRETFFVQVIEVTSEKFMTPRGIKVGDTVEDLKHAYPIVSLSNDGKSEENNGVYAVWGHQNELYFTVEEGRILKIRLLFELL
jgi:hypothetical protein